MAAPMPLDAPVTTATLPVSLLNYAVIPFVDSQLHVLRGVKFQSVPGFLGLLSSPLDLLGATSPPSLNFFAFAHPPS